MALAAQALLNQAPLDAAEDWAGAAHSAPPVHAGRAVTRVPHPAASADKLLQGLLAVFTEKQLQRALAIVDQVCARVRSAAVDRGNASRFAHRARGQTL